MRRLPPFWVQMVLGLVLGVVLGWVARVTEWDWLGRALEETGGIFVQLLRLAVAPLVFFAVMLALTRLREVAGAARLAARTLVWFLATSLVAVGIGMTIGLLTNPGAGSELTPADGEAPAAEDEGGWLDFLTGIVPTDLVTPFADLEVLQVVFLGAVAGAAALQLGERAAPLLGVAESVLELLHRALWWLIRLAPLGTLGLIGNAVNAYGWELLDDYATFTAGVYGGCLLVLLVVYPLLLRLVAGVSPLRFFRVAWPALQLAFVSRSSVGTLPVTQRVTERLGVPADYNSFAVPLGATMKMDGCAAVYPALAAIFVAEIFGVTLEPTDYLLIAFVSVAGSAATAGLTGATVMTTLTLSTLGLPLEGVGLLLAIDPVLDMMRTATNVAGQAAVPLIVAAQEGILDRDAYERATGFDATEAFDASPSVAEPTAVDGAIVGDDDGLAPARGTR